MDTLACSLEGRSFLALLNGLSKKLFFGESSAYSYENLADQLYGGIELERPEIFGQMAAFEDILKRAADGNWEPSKLEEGLKRSQSISAENLRVIVAFWTSEREKIHNELVRASRWNRNFNSLSWRVDVKSTSKNSPDLNEPVAFFELSTTPGCRSKLQQSGTAKFEMNRAQVGEILSKLEEINRKLDEASF